MQQVSEVLYEIQNQFSGWTNEYDPEGIYTKVVVGIITALVGWITVKFSTFFISKTWRLSKTVCVGSYRFVFPVPLPTPVDPQMAALEHCLDDPEIIWDSSKGELLADNLLVRINTFADGTFGVRSAITDCGNGEDVCADLEDKERLWLTDRVNHVIKDIMRREKNDRRLRRASRLMSPPALRYNGTVTTSTSASTPVAEAPKKTREYEPIITEALRRLRT